MENFSQQQANPKILRAPSLKRGKPDERITDRIKLEKVLGVTVSTNSALDCDPNSEIVAYPAGCTVVLFNTQTGQQNHIINTSRKSITSLAFSSCGRYLVTGECGHQPAVRVWDLQSDPQSSGHPGLYPQVQQVAEFLSHKYGICCVAFSPTNKYVVSVGTQHDMIVNVWDWKNNIKVASNKVSTKVKSLAFSENGSYFVTVGNRHVKFWFLEYGKAKYKEAVPLMGRSAILGEQRNNYFCDVACGKADSGDSTYAITRSGLLCEFNNRRLLDKWVELRTTSANCIAVGKNFIFVGCADGIVRCFDPLTLKFVTTLPRTHYLGVDVSLGTNITHMSTPPNDAKYPDTTAIAFDESSNKLTCIYNDHSIYVWDVHNIKRVGKSHSCLYHSACIWGVEMAPPNSPLPPGSFLTCSSDDTIRVWSLDKITEKNSRGMYKRNIYSNELLKVVYIDEDLTYLKDLDISANNVTNEKQDTSYDGRNGVRCIRLSPDGKNLASGDRAGNIRIHDTSTMERLLKIEAHDAEVLCLEYSGLDMDIKLMTSASRDRLIHVFDVNRGYVFLQTLDDHSSSITAVRLLNSTHGNLQMVSCGADKSLIFRSLGGTPNGNPQFVRGHNATGKTTLYDMEIDAGQKHVLTACQDRNVRIYSVSTGKHTKSFKGSTGDDGTLIKVVLDRSGIYLATSCTDKSLSVYDYYTGECMATMCGHSELATGLRFTNDCRRLISASGDGCIFVWRVPHDMVVTMHARLSQQAMRQGKTLDNEIFSDGQNVDLYDTNEGVDNDYRFSIGQLPLWAKKHISEDTSPPISLTKGVVAPKGRWAQRAERSVGVKSFYTTDSVIPFPGIQDRRLDSDGSKDSSLDSGTEIKQYSELRREIIINRQEEDFTPCADSFNEINKSSPQISPSNITISRGELRRNLFTDDSALGSLRDPDNESTAHDGDIDSDQEYKHQPLYYPTQIDSASGSEFTITNIDADELRKSIRKSKKGNLPPIAIQQPVSISGSQDSDDDEDDASTPSGENTDRNPLSILSLSSESLDQLASREKYLQSTFESLSGAEIESPINKSSISSQYHTTRTNGTSSGTSRNISVINAARQTKNDPDTLKKREELSKMIADTKKKLATVGHNSPLKYSKSIHDLSHIPEKDKWGSSGSRNSKQGNERDDVSERRQCDSSSSSIIINDPITVQSLAHGYQLNRSDFPYAINDTNSEIEKATRNSLHDCSNLASSISLPVDLQLCGCHMKDIIDSNYSNVTNLNSATILSDMLQKSPEKSQKDLAAMIKPRKLQLDKTLTKYKMHKSLPVSPVSEECRLSDFVAQQEPPKDDFSTRRSFSYFVDFKDETDRGFKQICEDIEKFSQDFSKNYEITFDEPKNDDEDANFSSDSLEDCSFNSTRNKKQKNLVPPRRCVSNNEIYKYQTEERNYSNFYHTYDCDIPKSESFYLNPSNKNSQDSILSEENLDYDYYHAKSYCNSLESVLSNESDCKSAPLEILFTSQRKTVKKHEGEFSKSLPKNITNEFYNYKNYDDCDQYLKPYSTIPDNMRRSQTFTAVEISSNQQKTNLRTSQTQTELNYRPPEEVVAKKSNVSSDFQQKLLKFESCIAYQNELKLQTTSKNRETKKSIAFFVETEPKQKQSKSIMKERNEDVKMTKKDNIMHIPTLESKNRQYRSKFCNVLNNKPEFNIEIFESGNRQKNSSNFTLTNFNFDHRTNKNQNIQETSSLDRHLLSKGLLDSEKICHKPPKAVRRHSSKGRKGKTSYEYIRKDDFFRDLKKHNNSKKSVALNNCSNENLAPTVEQTIEFHYKEKNLDKDCENGNSANALFTELYDSLDKPISNTKMEHDSLEVNLNNDSMKMYDSLEVDAKNVFAKNSQDDECNVWKNKPHKKELKKKNQSHSSYHSAMDRIQFALQNIKILNEIQKKIHKINNLVDIFKQNMSVGKVRALSSMYESLTNSKSYYNDLSKHEMLPTVKFRRRNLSLPNFVERRLNYEGQDTKVKSGKNNKNKNGGNSRKSNVVDPATPGKSNLDQSPQATDDSCQAHLDSDNPDTSLRRSCSLSDLSMSNIIVQPKRKIEQVSGKLAKSTSTTRANSRYAKSLSITRSSSTGVLNQSDSDNEAIEKKTQSRLMRPTISSLNKLANVKNTNMRKRHSHSVMNLSTVGNEDSSSEDGEKRIQIKPTAPPRTRTLNSDPSARKSANNKEPKPKAINRALSYDKNKEVDLDSTLTSVFDDSTEDLDVSTVQLSTQLCDEVALQLTKAANNVVELYRRLTDVDANTSEQLATVQKTDMVKNLELSITRTQKMLQELQLERIRRNNDLDVNQTDTVKKLNDLASRGLTNDQNTVISMMQQYSDILLGLMQQKIQNTNNT